MQTVLLSAEGMAELQDAEWVRDATEDEVKAFQERHNLTEDEYREVVVDKTGRPYWLVTLLEGAPEVAAEVAAEKASTYARVRSLVW